MQPQHIPSDSTAVSGVSGSGGAMTPSREGEEVRAAAEADGDDWGAKPTANKTAADRDQQRGQQHAHTDAAAEGRQNGVGSGTPNGSPSASGAEPVRKPRKCLDISGLEAACVGREVIEEWDDTEGDANSGAGIIKYVMVGGSRGGRSEGEGPVDVGWKVHVVEEWYNCLGRLYTQDAPSGRKLRIGSGGKADCSYSIAILDSMTTGETAVFKVNHANHPLQRSGGSAGPCRIFPYQHLWIKITVLSMEPPKAKKHTTDFADFAEECAKHLTEGSRLLGEGKYGQCVTAYNKVLGQKPSQAVLNSWAADEQSKALDFFKRARLNQALGYLKRVADSDAKAAFELANKTIDLCTAVIKDHPDEAKAYFRRAKAFLHTKNYQPALSDLQRAHSLVPADQLIVQEYNAARQTYLAVVAERKAESEANRERRQRRVEQIMARERHQQELAERQRREEEAIRRQRDEEEDLERQAAREKAKADGTSFTHVGRLEEMLGCTAEQLIGHGGSGLSENDDLDLDGDDEWQAGPHERENGAGAGGGEGEGEAGSMEALD
ncbi:unnamed protein product [Vitrella brassicaformis CCMP3155]|uniref:Uncharacterized protein n=1 Tax=Vitrella brassicaformis (strain CCMP3155) TaxID=1169540 RepID=A0A0G4EK85_VITBC|nr:unnamed protein product [Vitrella brassicaformis CCMP3155]|eukprot:CEL96831.1 unnamed protein product [Vitrella brassicaformis CCMP3155]